MEPHEMHDKLRKWNQFHNGEWIELTPPAPQESTLEFYRRIRCICGKLGYIIRIHKDGDHYFVSRVFSNKPPES
jgi:hypothetical protein